MERKGSLLELHSFGLSKLPHEVNLSRTFTNENPT